MDTSPEQMESLNRDIEKYEQKARRRAWLSAVVPFLFGVVLLGYTIWQIQNYGQKLVAVQASLEKSNAELDASIAALQDTKGKLEQANTELATVQNKLNSTTSELEGIRQELNSTQQELSDTNDALQSANIFLENAYTIDPYDEKNSLSYYPYQADVLYFIQELQYAGVKWNPNGFSEEEGFNSPNFTVYVLQHFGYVSNNYAVDSAPWQILSPVSEAAIGDIIYYEGGYSMFYFEINREAFVIGMTPLGIIAQQVGFAPILGSLHVPYP